MIRVVSALIICSAVAACGVDGDPETPPQPQSAQPPPDVNASVTITDNGIYPAIGVSQGWLNVYVGTAGWW